MQRIKFNANNQVDDYTIVLSTRNHTHLGQIKNIKDVSLKGNLASAQELSFTVYKELDNGRTVYTEPLWDNIENFKLVWVKELDEYFEIYVSLDDSTDITKSVTATSACEAELSQIKLYNMEINTEDDIARTDYVKPTVFYRPLDQYVVGSKDYNENKKSSLLHRILDKVDDSYTIKHVDLSLMNIQRSFSIDDASIYDFMAGECAEQFHCLFEFNSVTREISVYDLYTVCQDCGERGEFQGTCTKCGSTNLKYFGEDTTIYVDKENLTDAVNLSTDTDSVKNCFRLEAGDDSMTAAVISLNQNGSPYIYCISEEQRKDMPIELVNKLDSYDKLYASYTDEYKQLLIDLYDCIDKILYYQSSMMPTIEHAETNATKEAAKLNTVNLSPLGLSSVTTSTSVATVNSALKNYAKVYVDTGSFKLEVNDGTFEYEGIDSDGYNYGYWYGNFKVTNYSDEEDVATSEMIRVKVHNNYADFVDQKIKKNIATNDDDEGSIYDVLAIDKLSDFKTALTYYSLNRLTSFYDAIQGALDVLVEADQATASADLYEPIYVPYYNKLQACQAEIDKRQATINEWTHKQDLLLERQQEIQAELNFEDYIGKDLYKLFCLYRREQKYSNSNYISDGLDNDEIFKNAQDFLETARKELIKSSTHQHSISSTLYNLLTMKEFQPIVDKFQVGNWIRIRVDGVLYRLRLVSFEISFSDLQTINVEFSDLIKINDCVSDVQSIVSSALSMAGSYSYISKQAEKGNSAANTFNKLQEEGLNSALYKIKNADTEEVTFDKHGLLCRSYDDISDSYGDEQFKAIHNVLAFTDDNWKTVKTALGKQTYTLGGTKYEEYALNAETVIGGKVIAGQIYSANWTPSGGGTHFDLNTGNFSLADKSIVYDDSTKKLTMIGVTIDWNTSTTPGIDDINGLSTHLSTLDEGVDTAQSVADNAKTIGDTLVKGLGFQETSIAGSYVISPVIAGGTLLIGDKSKTYAEITSGGVLNCAGANISGHIIATSGRFTGTVSGSTITGSTFLTQNSAGNSHLCIKDNGITTYSTNTNYLGIEIYDQKIDFYSWSDGGNFVGRLCSSTNKKTGRVGIALIADYGDSLHLGCYKTKEQASGGIYTTAIEVNGKNDGGVKFCTHIEGSATFKSSDGGEELRNHGIYITSPYGTEAWFHGISIGLISKAPGGNTTATVIDKGSVKIDSDTSVHSDYTYYEDSSLSVYGGGKTKVYDLYAYGTIYGTVSTSSDKNVKHDISELDIEKSANFIYSLKPLQFKYNNGTSNRFHHGLIAQEVKESMGADDWGVYISNTGYDENNEYGTRLSLRYEEFIADLIATVKSQNERIKKLESLVS